jgi:hypothetical protein
LGEYLAHVTLMTSTSESDMNAKNTVSLMTVHSAKGLEFDHVYVTGLEEGTFPHNRAVQEDANAAALQGLPDNGNGPATQEERRLMYVALTRARKTLELSHSDQRMINGQILNLTPSRFLDELPAQHLRLLGDRFSLNGGGDRASSPSASARRPAQGASPQGASTSRTPGAAGTPSAPRGADRADPALARTAGQQPVTPPSSPPSGAGGGSVFAALAAQHSRSSRGPAPAASVAPPVKVPQAPQAPQAPQGAGPGTAVAIIGTAGRDKDQAPRMTRQLWHQMLAHAQTRVRAQDTLISGGAAWADHLAVELFLMGHAQGLTLHLPADLESCGRFAGGYGTAGGAANYYHDRFRQVTGIDGLARIAQALARGARHTQQPTAPGYEAMKTRNQAVAAEARVVLAYTWGSGHAPADGGTLHTWNLAAHAKREHFCLQDIEAQSLALRDVQDGPNSRGRQTSQESIDDAVMPQDFARCRAA